MTGPLEKVSFFFSCSKAGRRESVKVTTGPWVPIIPFCTPLARTDLGTERERRTLRVARESRVTKFVKLPMLQWVLNLTRGSVLLSSHRETRKGKGWRTDTAIIQLIHTHATFRHVLQRSKRNRYLINPNCTFFQGFIFVFLFLVSQ